MSKRYKITLSPSWEVGVQCLHLEVSTRTRKWTNGPILTNAKEFSILNPEARRDVRRLARAHGGIENLLEGVEEGDVAGVDMIAVKMVIAGCKTNRPYLYVSDFEFLSERDLINYAKEGDCGD